MVGWVVRVPETMSDSGMAVGFVDGRLHETEGSVFAGAEDELLGVGAPGAGEAAGAPDDDEGDGEAGGGAWRGRWTLWADAAAMGSASAPTRVSFMMV